MKVKKEYAVLAAVIVALGLYLTFRHTDRTSYTLPELPALKTQDLTKIEIRKGEKTVDLIRGDGGWRVSPGDYPADVNLVNRMLDDLAGLKVTALVSETRNYDHYDLDDNNQIRVTAYQDDKTVRAFHIGKAAGTMRHTHITLVGDANVYHAQGNFRHDFDQSVESLRDKAVLAFNRSDVTEFTIEAGDRKVTIKKIEAAKPSQADASSSAADAKAVSATSWQTADGQTVANEAVERLLGDLSGLKCRAYVTDPSKTDFTTPAYRIRIQAGETSTLDIFAPKDEAATEVPAHSSLRADPFTLADFDLDPIKDFLADLNGREEKPTAESTGTSSP